MASFYLVLLLFVCVSSRAVEEFQTEADDDQDTQIKSVSNADDVTDVAVAEDKEPDSDLDHWYGSTKVAFSAYLSKEYQRLGKGQHVKFDAVLLNDGDGYEPATGIFRAKVAGVYMFTYVVAQRHRHEIRVKLVYDGKTINGAIAEGMHKWHDAQGTNTAIIHVCKDKAVWVEAVTNDKLEGNNADYRYTTFSGHLLYARR